MAYLLCQVANITIHQQNTLTRKMVFDTLFMKETKCIPMRVESFQGFRIKKG